MRPLSIAIANEVLYDALLAQLEEGLTELGHRVLCRMPFEGSGSPPVDVVADFSSACDAADLIVVPPYGSRVAHTSKCILVDNGDGRILLTEGRTFRMAFKRETRPGCGALPLPMCAQRAFFRAQRERTVPLACLMQEHQHRREYMTALRQIERAIVLHTGETTDSSGKHASPLYYDTLSRSRIAVNLPGMGQDTYRHWEILAAGCLLLTAQLDIEMPDPLHDGEHCAVFHSVEECLKKARYLLAHEAERARIAAAGYRHCLRFHTSIARARYFLAKIAETAPELVQ